MRIDRELANKEIKVSCMKGGDKKVPVSILKADGSYIRFDQYKGLTEATDPPVLVEFYPWKDSPNFSETELIVDQEDPRKAVMVISGADTDLIRVFRAFFRCRGINKSTGELEVLFYGSVDLVE